jgi:hypothetical protein
MVNDAHNLNQAISQLTQKEVFAITRRALGDLATVSLEERMGEVFDRRLRELNGPAKNVLGDALKKNSEPALIRSTFDLPAAQRAAIQNALNETFSAEIHIRFETSPELVSGIELSANGQKVGWSIAEYLASLENGVGKLLKEKDKPAPKPEDKSTPKAETSAEPRSVPVPPHETEAKAKVKPKVEAAPTPEVKPEPKPEVKVEPKAATSKPEVKPATKPEVNPKGKPATESGTKTEIKVGPESGALTKEPSALTPQMFKKVHEFYEELGRADVQAVQAWENTEKENRKGEEKATTEAKPNIEAVPSPETTEKPETETKAEIKTEPKAELKAEEQHADPKS